MPSKKINEAEEEKRASIERTSPFFHRCSESLCSRRRWCNEDDTKANVAQLISGGSIQYTAAVDATLDLGKLERSLNANRAFCFASSSSGSELEATLQPMKPSKKNQLTAKLSVATIKGDVTLNISSKGHIKAFHSDVKNADHGMIVCNDLLSHILSQATKKNVKISLRAREYRGTFLPFVDSKGPAIWTSSRFRSHFIGRIGEGNGSLILPLTSGKNGSALLHSSGKIQIMGAHAPLVETVTATLYNDILSAYWCACNEEARKQEIFRNPVVVEEAALPGFSSCSSSSSPQSTGSSASPKRKRAAPAPAPRRRPSPVVSDSESDMDSDDDVESYAGSSDEEEERTRRPAKRATKLSPKKAAASTKPSPKKAAASTKPSPKKAAASTKPSPKKAAAPVAIRSAVVASPVVVQSAVVASVVAIQSTTPVVIQSASVAVLEKIEDKVVDDSEESESEEEEDEEVEVDYKNPKLRYNGPDEIEALKLALVGFVDTERISLTEGGWSKMEIDDDLIPREQLTESAIFDSVERAIFDFVEW